jgi:hypothetical protein
MKNNIKKLLDNKVWVNEFGEEKKGISINKFANDLDMYYKTAFALVKREDLSDTKMGTLQKVAEYLEVNVEELYK